MSNTKGITVSLDVTEGVIAPPGTPPGSYTTIRVVLTAPSGTQSPPQDLTTIADVRFGGLVAGQTYTLSAGAIDKDGKSIGPLQVVQVLVPVAAPSATYTRVNGIRFVFTDE